MNEMPFTLALLGLEIGFSILVLDTLRRVGASGGFLLAIGAAFALWLFADYQLLARGFFSASGMPQLVFAAALALPVVLGFIATRLSAPLRHAVAAMTTADFLRLQATQVLFGGMFFFTIALPSWIQIAGGVGDVIAGGSALLALQLLRGRPDRERLAVLLGNLPGIVDFLIILSLGVFVLFRDQSPDMPFDLIPLFVVPTYILLHFYSLARLGALVSKDGISGKKALQMM